MLSNKKVIDAFINGKAYTHNVNLRVGCDGDRIINYSTTLAQMCGKKKVIYNNTKYSVSTSKIQSWLLYALKGFDVIFVDNVPMGTIDLKPFTRKKRK